MYDFGKVKITDTPRDLVEDGRPVLRRTLTLDGGDGRLYFRAAVDKDITEQGDGVVHVGRALEIRAPAPILRKGDKESELLVPVTFENGKATLEIEYRWREEKK